MPVVWSDRCLLHEPGQEIWVGVPTPAAETPDRIERIRAALTGAQFVEAEPHDDAALLEVHDEELVAYLHRRHAEHATGNRVVRLSAEAGLDLRALGLRDQGSPGQTELVRNPLGHGRIADV